MKLVKMSLAAAMLMGATSAFAIEDLKIDGGAALYYWTFTEGANDAFDQASSYGEASVNVGATAKLNDNFTGGVRVYAVDTLGLESNVVGGTWTNAMGASLTTEAWASEAYLVGTFGKTVAKIGRQDLDTPFAFTETWSVAPNTFDAAVLVNSDIPDTTIVGAWVGKHNSETAGWAVVNDGAEFNTFGDSGAYALGVVNNSYKPLTAQLWYYELPSFATAYWLQADLEMEGFVAGAQYADLSPETDVAATDSSAYALKFGYNGIENLTMFVAYSETDEDGSLAIANVATGAGSGAQSKLYTEAWWDFGVGMSDTKAMNFTAEYSIPEIADLGLYATNMESDTWGDNYDVTLSVAKSFGALDTSVAYTMDDIDGSNLQIYLSTSF